MGEVSWLFLAIFYKKSAILSVEYVGKEMPGLRKSCVVRPRYVHLNVSKNNV